VAAEAVAEQTRIARTARTKLVERMGPGNPGRARRTCEDITVRKIIYRAIIL
jgi:hypothetical protein